MPKPVRLMVHTLLRYNLTDNPSLDQAENFAQETVIALFDKVVPGGIGTVEPNWKAIFHQYATVQAALGDSIIPGGTCRNRFANA